MTMPFKPLAIVAVLSLTLPGCSALFGSNNFARSGGQDVHKSKQMASQERAGMFTSLGRRALDNGNSGLAIEAFRQAMASGEEPAPAFNGLGVAYARIGRVDLAQRYFEQATALVPNEPRYQANLARLIASPLFARRHDGDRAEALLAAAQTEQTAREQLRQAAAPGQLQRVGANQFYIQTAAPAAGSAPARMALVTSRTKAGTDPALAPAKPDPAAPNAEQVAKAKSTPRTVHFKPAVTTTKP